MRFIAGDDRNQMTMTYGCLDDYIKEDSSIRVLDFFIENLCLDKLGFDRTVPKSTGRKPYSPKTLLKLYLYGYLNGIRSGRKLEKETKRNLEVMWLVKNLSPDFKTICDFRKDNKKALKSVFREFTFICRQAKLLDFNLVAIDGSFIAAVNHNGKNYTEKKVRIILQKLDEDIERYFIDLDATDTSELSDKKSVAEQIGILKQKKAKFEKLYQNMKDENKTQISLTDPDSKMMKKSKSKTDMSYNVQTAVDSKHKLIVEYDVTNDSNDLKQLSKISQQVIDTHELCSLEVTADKGYSSGQEIKKCLEINVTPYVPIINKHIKRGYDAYSTDKFIYSPEGDCILCPAGKNLPRSYRKENRNQTVYGSRIVCKDCKFRNMCCPEKQSYRRIWLSDSLEIFQEQEVRNLENPEKLSARICIVEHPFGTIKHAMNQSYFLMKGFAAVNGEFALTALAYNFKRAFNILGFASLMRAVMEYFKELSLNLALLTKIVIFFQFKQKLLSLEKR